MTAKTHLHAPCGNCPFRKDRPFYLRPGRAREIAMSFTQADFTCHKTIDYDEDVDPDSGEIVTGGEHQKVCGGMLGMMRIEGFDNQMVRIAERLGLIDWEKVDASNVYPSRRAFVEAMDELHGEQPDDVPHCEVVGPGCEDPPGWMSSGGVVENMDPGLAELDCSACGRPMCPACADDGEEGLCVECAEDGDE